MTADTRPSVLVARAIFPEVLDHLALTLDVESNQADDLWSREQMVARLQGKQGVLTTGAERIDATLLRQTGALALWQDSAGWAFQPAARTTRIWMGAQAAPALPRPGTWPADPAMAGLQRQ